MDKGYTGVKVLLEITAGHVSLLLKMELVELDLLKQ
jgi:hypothetical protein